MFKKVTCWLIFIVIGILLGGLIGWLLSIAAGSFPLKFTLAVMIIATLSFYGGMRHERERRLKQFRLQKKKTLY